MSELFQDPIVIAAVGAVLGSILGFILAKIRFNFVTTETLVGVVLSVLRAIEEKTDEGEVIDTVLDNIIQELELRFGEKKMDKVMEEAATFLSEEN
jgi:hypothetical protein